MQLHSICIILNWPCAYKTSSGNNSKAVTFKEQSPSLEATVVQLSINSLPFIDPKGSLLCSKEPATHRYPQPVKFCPQPPILYL
jgi:hypothetical protein